jgi:Fe-coproporphyrin III synthase
MNLHSLDRLPIALVRLPGFLLDAIRNRGKGSLRPRLLTYTVTFRCNAKCIMCDSWKMNGDGDMTLDEIAKVFRQIGKLDAVRLTGGEPFVRTDLPAILDLAVRHLRPLGVHITTNGFLTDRIVRLCEDRNRRIPLQLLVSLDGVEEAHNRIRGSNIAWKTAIETIEQLAGRQQKLNLNLAVNQTIVDSSGLEQYRLLRERLRPLGIKHQTVMAYDTSATYNLKRNLDVAPKQIGEFATHGKFTPSELTELFTEIESDLKDLPIWTRAAKNYYLQGIKQRLLPSPQSLGQQVIHRNGHSLNWFNPKCVALHSHLRVFPNGDVPTCQFNSKTIGNLKRQSFEEVWSSQLAQNQRKWVRDCVGCWAECEVVPNAIYTLDLIKPTRATNKATTPEIKPQPVTLSQTP